MTTKGKIKNAEELSEILSSQLDILTRKGVSDLDIKAADAVSRNIGKILKLSALRIVYSAHLKKGGTRIRTLEG